MLSERQLKLLQEAVKAIESVSDEVDSESYEELYMNLSSIESALNNIIEDQVQQDKVMKDYLK